MRSLTYSGTAASRCVSLKFASLRIQGQTRRLISLSHEVVRRSLPRVHAFYTCTVMILASMQSLMAGALHLQPKIFQVDSLLCELRPTVFLCSRNPGPEAAGSQSKRG